MIAFIGEHKDSTVGGLRWGVEPMCTVLTEHGIEISPSTYYEWAAKTPTARQVRDEEVVAVMVKERTTKPLVAALGSRKMWLYLRGKGHDVARCTIERLYREQGWEGARYGKKPRTTIPNPGHERAPDLVHRRFFAPVPNRLWVADFTQVATWSGKVYIAFVIDAYSRRIVGWRVAPTMSTALVLDALEHALHTRAAAGVADVTGLISHSDAGSQYTSLVLTSRLVEAGADPSVGSVGDALDNALAETTVGSFKTELIRRQGPWRDIDHVEIETMTWVDFFNTERPHEYLDDLTPVTVENLHYAQTQQATPVS